MKLTYSELIESMTSEWKGERDKHGRPLVPDDILERMELVTTEEAWGVLRRNGYNYNFTGNWQILHPEKVLVGRAVTCRFVPMRPDLHNAVNSLGATEGRIGGQNSWVIDELAQGDVIVVDLFGKVRDGTFAGDNLSTAIKANTNRGMVIEGGIRDTQRIMQLEDFNGFVRGFDPTAIANVTLAEINGITRIGEATCLPGDVVLGTLTGVIFIPPHLAEEVVTRSEEIRLKDEFGQQRIREGVYTPGEVDRQFSEAMNQDFERWKAERLRRRR
ncbi:MAG: RraA family protein [Chloroflexi bacterium]|nr:RraA family protein [Chloroflexota bacterium]